MPYSKSSPLPPPPGSGLFCSGSGGSRRLSPGLMPIARKGASGRPCCSRDQRIRRNPVTLVTLTNSLSVLSCLTNKQQVAMVRRQTAKEKRDDGTSEQTKGQPAARRAMNTLPIVSPLARLSGPERGDQAFRHADKLRAGAFGSDALKADTGAFKQQRQCIGKKLCLADAGIPTQADQTVALSLLEFLDYPTGRMVGLAQLDGGVGHVATAAVHHQAIGCHPDPGVQLRKLVARMLGLELLPHRVGAACGRPQALDDQIVLRLEMTVERHLVGTGGLSDRVDTDALDAMLVEHIPCRLQDAIPGADALRSAVFHQNLLGFRGFRKIPRYTS
ncbi:hypothetical protein MES4922_230221 [Mesorhizobium ventifaucium]|uniref:Uncharacterized protein n=1 Tax=Mesorhizobium ventifaucium TaxID=666020 RepID=A0ABM9DU82_9HYPH|nr:hypothetical protein MES4922_230221 [Mesorhizobium ventifaucium]